MAKVIFLHNIKGVGQVGDVKNVSDGYARNFLLPKKLAKIATPESLKEVEFLKKKLDLEKAKEREGNVKIAGELNNFTLLIEKNVNEEGTLYDGLDASEISKNLKKEGYNIEPEVINIKEPIKKIGEYSVPLKIDQDLEIELKINVVKSES